MVKILKFQIQLMCDNCGDFIKEKIVSITELNDLLQLKSKKDCWCKKCHKKWYEKDFGK